MEKFINSQPGITYSVSTNCSPGVSCNDFVGITYDYSSYIFYLIIAIVIIFIIISFFNANF